MAGSNFATQVVAWQRQHGRNTLPWQNTQDPYRVWLSEIMLQQTQVVTVIGYFAKFLERCPTVADLAAASSDEVMGLWSGLGYYSRARNLHRCAQAVMSEHGGVFPSSAQALEALPGIGASTAAAIAAFCHGERISIVDGNVRRVISRLLAFDGDLSQAAPQRALWDMAQALLPAEPSAADMVAYTQGLMDLGASICSRTQPGCERCPVKSLCLAQRAGTVDRFPVKTRKLLRRHESWWLLIWRCASPDGPKVWLERRPARGIWAGLYCTPVFDSEALAIGSPQLAGLDVHDLPPISHSLTHRELRLHPLLVDLPSDQAMPAHADGLWVLLDRLDQVGLPTPLRSLLPQLPG